MINEENSDKYSIDQNRQKEDEEILDSAAEKVRRVNNSPYRLPTNPSAWRMRGMFHKAKTVKRKRKTVQ